MRCLICWWTRRRKRRDARRRAAHYLVKINEALAEALNTNDTNVALQAVARAKHYVFHREAALRDMA